MKQTLCILSLSVLLLASCSKSSNPTSNNNNNNNNTPANTMIVTIDGQTDTLVATAKQTTSSGVTNITVAGAGSKGSGAGFTLVNITGTGTYNVGTVTYNGSSIQTVVMVDSYKDAAGQSANYTSPTVPGTTAVGTVTVTTLTSTSIIATFNGTLSKTSNSPASDPASSIVTNGSVNATIM